MVVNLLFQMCKWSKSEEIIETYCSFQTVDTYTWNYFRKLTIQFHKTLQRVAFRTF